MKNINKVRTANSRTLEFKDKEEMFKVLFIIKDLLVPYSDETIKTSSNRNDVEWVFWMKNGIKLNYWMDETIIDILISSENFNNIEYMFNKVNFRRGKNKFVFKGFNEIEV